MVGLMNWFYRTFIEDRCIHCHLPALYKAIYHGKLRPHCYLCKRWGESIENSQNLRHRIWLQKRLHKIPRLKNTICWALYTEGKMTDIELYTDVQVGRMWPRSWKEYYHANVECMKHGRKKYKWYQWIVDTWAIAYVRMVNAWHHDSRMRKVVWWALVCFFMLPGAFIVTGVLLAWAKWHKEKSDGKE